MVTFGCYERTSISTPGLQTPKLTLLLHCETKSFNELCGYTINMLATFAMCSRAQAIFGMCRYWSDLNPTS